MKLDGEQVFCHGTIDCEPQSKHFVYNTVALDSTGLKSGNGIVNEDQNGAFYDLKGRGGNTDQLQYIVTDEDGWIASKLDCSMKADASTDDNEKEVMPLTHSSLKVESFDRDSVFYVDKSVMEPELPELVVCYKENTYHVVKDICIDEGVPSQDKFLFDTDVEEENLCMLLSSEKNINIEVAKERVDQDMRIPDVLKSSAEDEKLALHLPIPDVFIYSEAKKSSKNEFSIECDTKESMPIRKLEDDAVKKIANDSSKEIFSLGELLSMPEVGTEYTQPKSSSNCMYKAEQQSIQRPNEDTVLAIASACDESERSSEQSFLENPVVSVAEKSDSSHEEAVSGAIASGFAAKASDHGHDETVSASPTLNSSTKESENGSNEEKMAIHNLSSMGESTNAIEHESSYNSNMKTKNTCDFNSSIRKASTIEEGSQNGGSEHVESRSSRHEETNTEHFSSQLQYSLGESSFSAAGPLSGLITYSGPIAYSGSLSLRSDSSTTSTRSFAFPILQSEWNSSPVRMVKADRRHLRKHRSWRQGLLCCRF